MNGATVSEARRGGWSRFARVLAVVLVVVAAVWGGGAGVAAPGGVGSGSLLAFGTNYYGELASAANNTTSLPNPTPTLVMLPGQVGPVTQAAAGGRHSLVVTSSGQLYAFGDNGSGELGSATNSGTSNPNPTPTLVTLPGQIGPITQIAAGLRFSLVVTSSGQLYAFGSNFFGQLGSATNSGTAMPNPTPTLVGLPGQIGPITQVAAGADDSLVVTSSGQLYAFGRNEYGQLGSATNIGTDMPNPTPTLVGLPGQIGPITQVAVGGAYSLVVTSSGQLYAFGDNIYGQLGSATNSGTGNPNPTPTLVMLAGQVGAVTQIAAGDRHSLVVTSSGQLYTFGENGDGQLGSATNSGTLTPNPTPALVTLAGQVGPVTQIAAGYQHSLVVTSSGQLYAFGYNGDGELGSATNSGTPTPNATPALVALAAGTTIDTVAKGSQALHSLVLVSDLAITTSALASAQVGRPYQAVLQASGGTAPLRWSASGLPVGLAIDPASGAITGTPSAAGSFSATVTLSDAYDSSSTQTFALSVAAATPVLVTPVLARAPRLSALKQSATRWRLGSKLAHLTNTAKTPSKKAGLSRGTTFSFRLDQTARVSFAFRHTTSGRKASNKCVAKTPGNANKPHCTRTLSDGTLRIQAHTGSNQLHFEGPISRRAKLKPGHYSVTITATNPAGKTSPPQTLRFTTTKS
jgi:alpha-tubulin suppressor-like RCC1 family protein